MNYAMLDERAIEPTKAHDEDAGYDLYAMEDCVIPSQFKCAWVQMGFQISNFVKKIATYVALPSWISVREKFPELSDEFSHNNSIAIKIPTGIAVEIPQGNMGLICDRSGLGSKLIKVFGGVIDSNYRGDVTVCLANLSFFDYHIKRGDRVAQLVIYPITLTKLVKVDKLETSSRGEAGFGSSGA